MDLRKPFFDNLIQLAESDKNVVCLVGDLGFNYVDKYAKLNPTRYINCGCMEDAMVDIAVGMALAGKKPYVYSVINFILFRAYEQARDDVCYNNANVKLVCVRGKEAYKFLGFSHNIVEGEDLALLKYLPNIKTCIPKNEDELKAMMISTYQDKCPTYLRI